MGDSFYKRCSKCIYVSSKKEIGTNNSCPNCGNTFSSDWIGFPSPAALGFARQVSVGVHSYDEEIGDIYDFHEIQQTCLLVCALYEDLLIGLVSDILNTMKVPQVVIELIFASNQGQDNISKAFRALKGISIKEALNTNYDAAFYDVIYKIIKGRNKYIHGDYTALDDMTIQDLLYIDNNMIKAFVKLHNVYCR